jgi:O-antigen ligase
LGIDLVEGSRAAWVGLFGDPNELAFSLVLLIPLTMALFDGTRSHLARGGLVIAAVIQVTGVVVTQSRGGLVGLLLVVALIAWSYKVRAAALVMVVAVAATVAALMSDALWQRLLFITTNRPDAAIIGRLEAWHVGWLVFLDRWWLGVGIGNFPLAWPLYAASPSGKWITAHNAFIQILGELGIMGLIGFAALLATTVVGLRRARLASSAAGAREIESFAKGLGIALWGYLSCSLFLSVAFNWFLYLILGLSVAVLAMAPRSARTVSASPWSGREGARPWG